MDGSLDLSTTARSVLGTDLPLIGDDVTVEHLLSHRSGIGDYLDEAAGRGVDDYVMSVPVQELATSEDYLAVLDGHPASSGRTSGFAYCNGGYVVLALIAERTSGIPFHELVRTRVCEPAGMADTEFLRSDELPGRAALGYLAVDGTRGRTSSISPCAAAATAGSTRRPRTSAPSGAAFFAGRIVPPARVKELVQPRSDAPEQSMRYGLGFWLHASSDVVMLEGSDAGVSFRSAHDPARRLTHTVISNTSTRNITWRGCCATGCV